MQQLFREAVDAPSLKVLKVRLDGIQTELGGGNTAMAGGLELDNLWGALQQKPFCDSANLWPTSKTGKVSKSHSLIMYAHY